MRVLQVCPAFYPAISIGGPIFTILSLQEAMAKRGNTIDVLATPLGLSATDAALVCYDVPLPLSGLGAGPGHIIYQRFYGYLHFTFSPQSLWWLLKNIRKYDVAVLHGIWNFPLLAAAVSCRLFKVPFFIFPHGTLYKETVELRSGLIKKIFLHLFVKRILKWATRVIFTTKDEKDKVTAFLKIGVEEFVMPNIVMARDFGDLPRRGDFRHRLGIANDALVLLHYGRISKKKGLEHSVDALSKLSEHFSDLVLAVVGGDEEGYRSVIEARARDLGVLDRVVFAGLVEPNVGKQALVDADIFVLPSLSENFGMAVVEAMLCGLPVVISDNVGIASDVADGGAGMVVALMPENEPLVAALAELLSSPDKRKALGARGREFAIAHYDESAVSSRVDELLALI